MFDTEIETGGLTEAEAAELKENISFFCNTPKGSLPQMRDYGLDYENIIDKPPQTAKTRVTVDLIAGLRKYYNIGSDSGTLKIDSITVIPGTDGSMKVKLIIGGK